MTAQMPGLFVSHGSPMLALDEGPAHSYLRELGKRLGKPSGIVVISAHHEEEVPTVTTNAAPTTIHDFGGFPRALFEMTYPAPGSPILADQVRAALAARGIASRGDAERGLDHGVWVPLSLMFPAADIPVVSLSVEPHLDTAYHFALGEALRPLREKDILIVGSGSITHNLRELARPTPDAAAAPWAAAFTDWIGAQVAARNIDGLLDYRARAPEARRAHPTEEHFLPFFAALGAARADEPMTRLHRSFTYGSLGMDVYAFGEMPR
ncbi:MAG TPA: class III extradiol ring-cleavage dioxygenase [Parvibaculum sp.]